MYIHPLGFKVIPASLNISKLDRKMRKELMNILDEVIHSSDFVIIDAAPGLGKEAQMAIDAGDEMIIVTNPEMPAVVDALKTIQLAKGKNSDVLGVVLNKTTGTDELSLRNVAHFLETPVIATISEERKMKESIRRREPLLSLYPRIRTSREFMNLARRVAELPEQEEPSILAQLARWLGL
jgi:septum site-determining protein MinD